MKTMISRLRRVLCTALVLLLCLTLLPMSALAAAAQASAATMRVVSYTGTVTVKNASGLKMSLYNNLQLYSGWTVETGAASYATLSLDGTKAIRLNYNTKVELRQNNTTSQLDLYVPKGGISFDVSEKLAAGASMNLSNGNLICGIRGTDGYFGQTLDDYGVCQDTVIGSGGTIEVKKTGSGETTLIQMGNVLTLSSTGKPQVSQISSWDQIPGSHVIFMSELPKDFSGFYNITGLKTLSALQVKQKQSDEEQLISRNTKAKQEDLETFTAGLLNTNGTLGDRVVNAWSGSGGEGSGTELPPTRPVEEGDTPENVETCTITFDLNYDTSAPMAQGAAYGSVPTLPIPTRYGYDFRGWYVDSGCTVPYDYNAAVVTNFTLYAKWEAKQYTITPELTANGGALTVKVGSGAATTGTVYAATDETVTLTATPAEGYRLAELTVTDADGAAVTVTNNQFTMPAKAVTVTATFEALPEKCTIRFSEALQSAMAEERFGFALYHKEVEGENVSWVPLECDEEDFSYSEARPGERYNIYFYTFGDVLVDPGTFTVTAGSEAVDTELTIDVGDEMSSEYEFTMPYDDVEADGTVATVYRVAGNGGYYDNGAILITAVGSVTLTEPAYNAFAPYYPGGQNCTVTVQVESDDGWLLKDNTLSALCCPDGAPEEELTVTTVDAENAVFSFVMGPGDVNLGAEYEALPYSITAVPQGTDLQAEIYVWDSEDSDWYAFSEDDNVATAGKRYMVVIGDTPATGGTFRCAKLISVVCDGDPEFNPDGKTRELFYDEEEETFAVNDCYYFEQPAGNVTITYGEETCYPVYVDVTNEDNIGGSVTVAAVGDVTIDRDPGLGSEGFFGDGYADAYAAPGDIVTLSIQPENGFVVVPSSYYAAYYYSTSPEPPWAELPITAKDAAKGLYTYTVPTNVQDLRATEANIYFTYPVSLTLVQTAGGTLTVETDDGPLTFEDGVATVYEGDLLYIVANPETGSIVGTPKVEPDATMGVDGTSDNRFWLRVPQEDFTVTGVFRHTITTSVSPSSSNLSYTGGTVKIEAGGAEVTAAAANETVTVTFAAEKEGDSYYGAGNVRVSSGGKNLPVEFVSRRYDTEHGIYYSTYSFVMPAADVTVSAQFSKMMTVTLAYEAGSAGLGALTCDAVEIEGAYYAGKYETFRVTVTPVENYGLNDLELSQQQQGGYYSGAMTKKDNVYTVEMWESALTITAGFGRLHALHTDGVTGNTSGLAFSVMQAVPGMPNTYEEVDTSGAIMVVEGLEAQVRIDCAKDGTTFRGVKDLNITINGIPDGSLYPDNDNTPVAARFFTYDDEDHPDEATGVSSLTWFTPPTDDIADDASFTVVGSVDTMYTVSVDDGVYPPDGYVNPIFLQSSDGWNCFLCEMGDIEPDLTPAAFPAASGEQIWLACNHVLMSNERIVIDYVEVPQGMSNPYQMFTHGSQTENDAYRFYMTNADLRISFTATA